MAYVYRHIRLDKNIPFYIGIGKEEQRAYSKSNRNPYWKKITNKTDYVVEILFNDISYELAKEKEKEFVALYKRTFDGGTLCNITLGGEGCLGMVHTDEAKLKIGLPHKGKKISKEHKKIISLFHTGKTTSEETKRKMSEAQKGEKNHSYGKKRFESTRLKMSNSAKKGEKNHSSKLLVFEVLEIRKMYSAGDTSYSKLAKIFNVTKGNILSIVNRKTWKHI